MSNKKKYYLKDKASGDFVSIHSTSSNIILTDNKKQAIKSKDITSVVGKRYWLGLSTTQYKVLEITTTKSYHLLPN